MKPKFLIIALIVFWASLMACSEQSRNTTGVAESKYKTGQVWSYKTRPNETDSKITILKVETAAAIGKVVHVSIEGLRISNPRTKEGFVATIPFTSFSEEAIDRSVVSRIKENVEVPDSKQAYEEWQQTYQQNQGGVFTMPVAEAIGLMEKNMNRPHAR